VLYIYIYIERERERERGNYIYLVSSERAGQSLFKDKWVGENDKGVVVDPLLNQHFYPGGVPLVHANHQLSELKNIEACLL